MDRDCLDRGNTNSFLNVCIIGESLALHPRFFTILTAQAVQTELIDPAHGFRILPVVLDDVDVVRGRE